ncbi:MAG: PEP-CTERM sorting domain-containing protein, partial [Thermodesulfobacteria bacterium]|nr:PEP-CTERM sorting domain-containing protein [Thermodesulfobacteriota bacterium]
VYCLLIVCFLLFLALSTVYALDFTFDTDNQGWEGINVGKYGGAREGWGDYYPASWTAELAGKNGVIYQTGNDQPEDRPLWMGYRGDTAFLGDLTGKTLVFDVYSSGNWRTLAGDPPMLRFYIGNRFDDGTWNSWAAYSTVSVDLNSFTGWRTFSIELKEENFFKWPNWQRSPDDTFADVLRNYDQIGFNLASNTDDINCFNGGDCTWSDDNRLLHYGAIAAEGQEATWALDNVRAVPEPSTLILLGGAGLIVLRLRRHLLRN